MTRPDHGENLTREACPDLSAQADLLLHDLLHGKHDEALYAATRRRGDEIECVYIHMDESCADLGWDVSAHAHITLEFLETPPNSDMPERAEVNASFELYQVGYFTDGPDGELDRREIEEDKQLLRLEVSPGTSSPRKLLGVRYNAVSWGPDTLDRMWYHFEKAEPEHQDPPTPTPIILPPVACDVDLPF